jgi:hypothetical protein
MDALRSDTAAGNARRSNWPGAPGAACRRSLRNSGILVALLRATALLLIACNTTLALAADPTPSEYQVKAVFLFNFTQFVEWPATAFPEPDAPFVIGVLGKDPFGTQLDAVVRGEHVDRHPLVIERYANAAQIQRCNILFIPRGQTAAESVPAAIKGRGVLTVSDADEADLKGIMIRLVVRNSRVRLRIDVDAAKADNLTISSKLLRPAEIVGRDPGG